MKGFLLMTLAILSPMDSLHSAPAQSLNSATGQFWRVHWYERGIQHGNPGFEGRFRVNSPEAVLHPVFGQRVEARENGMMLIRADEDLTLLTAAELQLELWGGHPGTANKRITVNGRGTYYLPRVGTEEMHCTYHYPAVALKILDLVNGYNALQFAIDQGTTFWGHMLLDNACLRVALTNGHPDLVKASLAEFEATVTTTRSPARPDRLELNLDVAPGQSKRIAAVEFHGFFLGYDENGDGRTTDWHGFTKSRRPVANLGTVTEAPFVWSWDTTMLPRQRNVSVRAIVHFKDQTNLVYVTAAKDNLEIPERAESDVILYSSHDLPRPFWSRANQKRECTIYLDVDPQRVERAELHVNAWTGGAGNVKEYFRLNGQHFPVAEGARHELIYSQLPVEPRFLRQGINRIELLSDTDHHGIEILLPGPCLLIRCRRDVTP